jgi:hypothetical protein
MIPAKGKPPDDLRAPVLAVAGVALGQVQHRRVDREGRDEERNFGEDRASHYSYSFS